MTDTGQQPERVAEAIERVTNALNTIPAYASLIADDVRTIITALTEAGRAGVGDGGLRAAAQKVIEMNLQHAQDQYGDRNKAETWACVTILREALAATPTPPAPATPAPDVTRNDVLEEAARMADGLEISIPFAPGMPDGVSIASKAIAAAIRALKDASLPDYSGGGS